MSGENENETSMIGSATEGTETPPENPGATPDPAPSTPPEVETEGEGQEAEGSEGSPEAPAPATIEELTLPEGLEIPEETSEQFLTLINDTEKSPTERAQAFVDLHHSLLQQSMTQTAEAYAEQWEQTQADWQKQVRELPGIGGDKLDASLGQIAKVLDRYGTQEARDALNMTGAGNHPALVQMFHAIAQDLNEKPPVQGAPASGQPRDRASRMYGNTEK